MEAKASEASWRALIEAEKAELLDIIASLQNTKISRYPFSNLVFTGACAAQLVESLLDLPTPLPLFVELKRRLPLTAWNHIHSPNFHIALLG